MNDIQGAIDYLENRLKRGISKCRRKYYETAISAMRELQRYHQIGTVEECREAREKQSEKKPVQGEPFEWIDSVRINGKYRDVKKTSYGHACSNCGKRIITDMNFCSSCGQAVDWSKGE